MKKSIKYNIRNNTNFFRRINNIFTEFLSQFSNKTTDRFQNSNKNTLKLNNSV